MRRRECFESHREYVEYLEQRVQFLERRLREYRNTNGTPKLERKRGFNEMAQPLHKKVVLTIPLPNNQECNPLEISFISRTTTSRGTRHHYIDMSDIMADRREQIRKIIDLQDNTNFNTSLVVRNREDAEINDFANQIADKYGNNNPSDIDYIKKVIISCYNDVVVDHEAKSQLKLPTDQYWVTCDSSGNLVPEA